MSYTPPAGDAANFSWVGEVAYTPPAGDAANFSWALPTPTPAAVSLKVWTGSAWAVGNLKRWNGSAWADVAKNQLNRWDGSAWVQAQP